MNESELRLAETLIETGRLRPDQLQQCLGQRKDGEGLIDALVRQGSVPTSELESVLEVLSHPEPTSAGTDPFVDAVLRLERYVVMNPLGRGGMGHVYLAYDTKLKRSVALKVMRTDNPEDIARYQREVEISARLQHPNIASIYDAHSVEGFFVIAMQFIEGASLDKARPAVREAMVAIAQAARAVHAAHQQGIIHRDLKPENLMRTPDGRLFVLDFGIARPIEKTAGMTQTGSIVGTPTYMSPEQSRGAALDPRTDVYSLGATLYALVTGHLPFEGASIAEMLQKVGSEEPRLPRKHNPRLSRDVETITLKAMRKDPVDRYATAEELALDIERFLAGELIVARPVSTIVRTARYFRRRPWMLATLVLLTVGLAAMAGILWNRERERTRTARANALVDEAARKIDEWDRLALLPPRDLTGYQTLLKDAIRLCEEAGPLPAAQYPRARAEIRLGLGEEAERSITQAIAQRPEGAYYLERARIRLQRLTRKTMGLSYMFMMRSAVEGNSYSLRLLRRYQADPGILQDLAEARRLGKEATFESGYIDALDRALKQDHAGSDRVANELLTRCSPWEQAEVHKLLSWVHWHARAQELGSARPKEIDFKPNPHMLEAIRHIRASLELRRSDADLYLMLALLETLRGSEPWSAVHFEDWDDFGTFREVALAFRAKVLEHRERLDREQAEACRAAMEAVDTALRIRPTDPEAYLLRANACGLSLPISEMCAPFDAFRADTQTEEERKKMLENLQAVMGRMKKEVIEPGKAACRQAIALAPDNPMAWAQLASCLGGEIGASYASPDREVRARLGEELVQVCTKALTLRPDVPIEISLRQTRAAHLGTRYMEGKKEEDRRTLLEDLARVRELDLEAARKLEKLLSRFVDLPK